MVVVVVSVPKKNPFEFLDPDWSFGSCCVTKKNFWIFGFRFKSFWSCCVTKKPFEFLDPDLKALDPRKLLKNYGHTYIMEKVKMKTNLERLRTITKQWINRKVLNTPVREMVYVSSRKQMPSAFYYTISRNGVLCTYRFIRYFVIY